MNYRLYYFAGLSTLLMLFLACQKTDTSFASPKAGVVNVPAIVSSWKSAGSWSTEQRTQFSIYSVAIAAPEITGTLPSDGLVIVYAHLGDSTVHMLPYQVGQPNPQQYWYYEVLPGSILIHCDAYNSQPANLDKNQFRYVALTRSALATLVQNGYDRAALTALTYDQIQKLLSLTR